MLYTFSTIAYFFQIARLIKTCIIEQKQPLNVYTLKNQIGYVPVKNRQCLVKYNSFKKNHLNILRYPVLQNKIDTFYR